jgi:hypothetical protein
MEILTITQHCLIPMTYCILSFLLPPNVCYVDINRPYSNAVSNVAYYSTLHRSFLALDYYFWPLPFWLYNESMYASFQFVLIYLIVSLRPEDLRNEGITTITFHNMLCNFYPDTTESFKATTPSNTACPTGLQTYHSFIHA